MAVPITLKASSVGVSRDTTANWDAHPLFVPKKGQLIVYSDHRIDTDGEGNVIYIPGLKVGDGKAYLKSLPFVGDDILIETEEMLRQHEENPVIHTTSEEKEFWNQKLNCEVDSQSGTLVLTRN